MYAAETSLCTLQMLYTLLREDLTECTYMRFCILPKIHIKVPVLWDVMPCMVCRYQPFRRICCLHLHGTMNMEVAAFFKTLLPTYQTIWCHIPKYCGPRTYLKTDWVHERKWQAKLVIFPRYKGLWLKKINLQRKWLHIVKGTDTTNGIYLKRMQ
jgi:hypothetical protein